MNTRHHVGGDTDRPGCDRGEITAYKVGYREGLRTLAKGIADRIELAATVNADDMRALLAPYLNAGNEDYSDIPRTDITPFGTPDHLYHRAASAINAEFPDEAKRGTP